MKVYKLLLDQLNQSLINEPYRRTVQTICVRPDLDWRVYPDSVELCPRRGAVGDRWKSHPWMRLEDGSADPRVQVAITNMRTLSIFRKAAGNDIYPGDTFAVDFDLSEASMPVGQIFRIGSAELEVSDVYNAACAKFAKRYGKSSLTWINAPENRHLRLRGIYCIVRKSGTVNLNDKPEKIQETAY